MRIRIKKLPIDKAAYGKQVDGALSLRAPAFGGADYNGSMSQSSPKARKSLQAVSRDNANIEAEGGETAFGPISGQSIPDHLKITGKRHHEGGVPLNLPDDTFIFSDTAALKINEPGVLAMFNKAPKKGGYTPAELAKPYDISKYKEILFDEDSSKLERNTATIMIKNYIMKLGALALVQESMKGFPQGIPAMAKPYMEANGIKEEDLIPELKEQADAMAQQQQMMQQQMPQANPEMMQDPGMGMAEPAYPEQMPSGAPIASPDMMAQMQGGPSPEMGMPPMMAYGGTPYGQYGMTMGGYEYPYGSQYTPSRMMTFKEGGYLPKAQGGIEITPEVQDEIDTKWAGDVKAYQRFKKLEATLRNDPNFIDELYDNYLTVIEDTESYTSGKKATWYPKLKTAGPQEVLQALLDQEERNRRLEAFGRATGKYDAMNTSQAPNEASGRRQINKETEAFIKENPGLQDLDFSKGYLSQAAYLAYDNIYAGEDKDRGVDPVGVGDELATRHGGKVSGIDNNSTNTTLRQLVYHLPEDKIEEEEVVEGPGMKELIKCRCTDPQTGEPIEFEVSDPAECECAGKRGEIISQPLQATPHWSVPAKRNILANALMRVKPAPTNVVLPDGPQVEGVYEEYQTKVDQSLAAMNQMQRSIMQGMSGSTASKQAMMKNMMEQGLNSAIAAVADVDARNVDRQRETNQLNAAFNERNMLGRTNALQQILNFQKMDDDTEIANRNKRLYNTLQAMNQADLEMAQRQQMNVTTPQYMSEYDYGFITPTGAQRPFTGEGGATFEDRVQYYLGKTGNYDKAFDMAWKEARLNKGKKGGFVYTDSVFPFII